MKKKTRYFLGSTVSFNSGKTPPKMTDLPAGTLEPREMLDELLEVLRRSTFDHNSFFRARMNKLKMLGMQCHAINQLLFRFFGMIFSITHQRMAYGGKLCADLVL